MNQLEMKTLDRKQGLSGLTPSEAATSLILNCTRHLYISGALENIFKLVCNPKVSERENLCILSLFSVNNFTNDGNKIIGACNKPSSGQIGHLTTSIKI